MTSTTDISAAIHERTIVIALICSIALIGLIIFTILICFCCKLCHLESVFENSNSPKRRVAKHKKKVKEYSVVVVEDRQPSPDIRLKVVHQSKLTTVPSQVQLLNATLSKGTAVSKSKTAIVATSPCHAVPSCKQQAVLSKMNVAKVCTSKQGHRKKKMASSAIAPPPHRLDSRFGTMNSKLLLDVDIGQPSKSALDLSSNSSITTSSFFSQNMSVGTALFKRGSTNAKVTSKHQKKRHHKHKKTA